MRLIPIAALMFALAATGGCAVKKSFYANGGSRADGTVDMAYDFAQFEQPVVNMDQAHEIAAQKCRVWGYQDAEMFGGKRQHCNQFNGYGTCIAGQVVIQYQCIGTGSGIASSSPAPSAPQAFTQTTTSGSGSLTREQWRQRQIDELNSETGLSYDEYQRRYRQIMGQ